MKDTFLDEALGFRIELGRIIYLNGAPARRATLDEERMYELLRTPQAEWHGYEHPYTNSGTIRG